MKTLFRVFVFMAFAVCLPTTVFASTDSNSTPSAGTLTEEECTRLQTTYAVESEHNCADVPLSTKILQVQAHLMHIQSELIPFLAADERMHGIIETFNKELQGVIHQMTVEHLIADDKEKPPLVKPGPLRE